MSSQEPQTDQQEQAQKDAAESQDVEQDEAVQQKAADLPGPGQPEEDVMFDQDTSEKDDDDSN